MIRFIIFRSQFITVSRSTTRVTIHLKKSSKSNRKIAFPFSNLGEQDGSEKENSMYEKGCKVSFLTSLIFYRDAESGSIKNLLVRYTLTLNQESQTQIDL